MSLVLITGVTGFIGFQVLLETLQEGYTVRAVVRSLTSIGKITSDPRITPHLTNLSFVEVPRYDVSGAYDEAIQGVTHFIHLASDSSTRHVENPEKDVFESIVNNIKSVLDTAIQTPTLQKLVLTSTGLAVVPFPPLAEEFRGDSEVRVPDVPASPFPFAGFAYWAAKLNSYNYARDFVDRLQPPFETAFILPAYVFGPDLRAKNVDEFLDGTNGVLLNYLTAQPLTGPKPTGYSHVEDIVRGHVPALKSGTKGAFTLIQNGTWDESWDFVQKHYPEAVKNGVFKRVEQPPIKVSFDSSASEKMLGFKLKSYEQIVVDAAGQYLDLIGAPRK